MSTTNDKIRISIFGGSGYGGSELLRIHELNPRSTRPEGETKIAVIAPADVVLVPTDDER